MSRSSICFKDVWWQERLRQPWTVSGFFLPLSGADVNSAVPTRRSVLSSEWLTFLKCRGQIGSLRSFRLWPFGPPSTPKLRPRSRPLVPSWSPPPPRCAADMVGGWNRLPRLFPATPKIDNKLTQGSRWQPHVVEQPHSIRFSWKLNTSPESSVFSPVFTVSCLNEEP